MDIGKEMDVIKLDDWIIGSWRQSLKRQQLNLEDVIDVMTKITTWHKGSQNQKVIDSMNCILAAIGEIKCAIDYLKPEEETDEKQNISRRNN